MALVDLVGYLVVADSVFPLPLLRVLLCFLSMRKTTTVSSQQQISYISSLTARTCCCSALIFSLMPASSGVPACLQRPTQAATSSGWAIRTHNSHDPLFLPHLLLEQPVEVPQLLGDRRGLGSLRSRLFLLRLRPLVEPLPLGCFHLHQLHCIALSRTLLLTATAAIAAVVAIGDLAINLIPRTKLIALQGTIEHRTDKKVKKIQQWILCGVP